MKKNTQNRRSVVENRLWLLLNLFFYVGSGLSYGQLINTTPLPSSYEEYKKGQAPSLPMHNSTSRSVVLFKRPLEVPTPTVRVSYGSAFFIRTDPKLEHYCLLTAGHTLFDGDNVSVEDSQMVLNMAFRVTYVNPRSTPATYDATEGAPEGLPIPVTVASAVVTKGTGARDEMDYGIVKISKLALKGISFKEHGISFLDTDGLPEDRFSDDPMKSAYVIHHADHRPQQISTLKKADFIPPVKVNDDDAYKKPKVYKHMFAIPKWVGITPGSSGAPLVLPLNPQASEMLDAPAIGLVAKKGERRDKALPVQQDICFQKLSSIKALIIQHCTGDLKKKQYEKSLLIEAITEKEKDPEPFFDKLKAALQSANDIVLLPSQLSIGGSIEGAATSALKCIGLIDNLKLLINKKGEQSKIQQGITELDLNITDFIQKFDAITIVNSAPTDVNPGGYKKSTKEAFEVMGQYFRILFGNTDDIVNREYKPNQYNTVSPTNFIPMLTCQIIPLMESIKLSVGSGSTVLRRKRDSPDQTLQMQAPSEVTDLQNTVLESVEAINDYFLNLDDTKSANVDFFYGLEHFYLNRDLYSNRFLQESFYTEEYRLTEYIFDMIEAEVGKNTSHSFLIKGTQSLNNIRAKLNKLKTKDYPRGFITLTPKNPVFDLRYYGYSSEDTRINASPDNMTWQSLGLAYESTANEYGLKNIPGTLSVKRTDVKGAFESWTGNTKEKQSYGRWYSTILNILATLDLNQVTYTYHPYLQQFITRNNITPKVDDSFLVRNTKLSGEISYDHVFDPGKIPAEGSAFVVGFGIKNYCKTQKETPDLGIGNDFEFKRIYYSIFSPELLVLARAYKEVSYIGVTPEHTALKYFGVEEETMEGNDKIGTYFNAMQQYAEKNLNLKYTIALNDNIKWQYSLPISGSTAPTKGRLAAPSVAPTVSAEARAVPTLSPNPVSDQLQLNLPPGYEQSDIRISNTAGSRMNLLVPRNGSQRLIDVRSLPVGMYFMTIQGDQKPKQTLKFLKQ